MPKLSCVCYKWNVIFIRLLLCLCLEAFFTQYNITLLITRKAFFATTTSPSFLLLASCRLIFTIDRAILDFVGCLYVKTCAHRAQAGCVVHPTKQIGLQNQILHCSTLRYINIRKKAFYPCRQFADKILCVLIWDIVMPKVTWHLKCLLLRGVTCADPWQASALTIYSDDNRKLKVPREESNVW